MQLEQRKKAAGDGSHHLRAEEEKAEQLKEKEKTPTEDTDPVQQAKGLEIGLGRR